MFHVETQWEGPEDIQNLNNVIFFPAQRKHFQGITKSSAPQQKSKKLKPVKEDAEQLSSKLSKQKRKQERSIEKEEVVQSSKKRKKSHEQFQPVTVRSTSCDEETPTVNKKKHIIREKQTEKHSRKSGNHDSKSKQQTYHEDRVKQGSEPVKVSSMKAGVASSCSKLTDSQHQNRKKSKDVLKVLTSCDQSSKSSNKLFTCEKSTKIPTEDDQVSIQRSLKANKCSRDPEVVCKKTANCNSDATLLTPCADKAFGKKQVSLDKLKQYMKSAQTSQNSSSVRGSSGEGCNVTQSLNTRMLNRLAEGQFRHINQLLYTSTGTEAEKLFTADNESFDIYHKGFQSQVEKWPVNPVDRMIEYIKSQNRKLVVADFGCGDAKIARSVEQTVHSFDLVAVNDSVTACNMAHVPLPSGSVDIAVFCLSLMGTNIVDYLCEANRVLKNRGVLLVAEVVSRFDKLSRFIKKMQLLGFTLVSKDTSNRMFVWMEYTKFQSAPQNRLGLPEIQLSPCVYKKR